MLSGFPTSMRGTVAFTNGEMKKPGLIPKDTRNK